MDRGERAYWIEVAGLAVLAVLLFRFGLLLVAFLLPIQVAWVRRGERAGLLTSGVFLALVAGLKLVDYLRVADRMVNGGAGLLFLDIVLPVGFLFGLYLLNTPVLAIGAGERRLGTFERLLAAVLGAVAIYVPASVLVYMSGVVDLLIEAQVELVRSLFSAAGATEVEIVELSRLVLQVLMSGFLLGYILLLAGSWWFGTLIALRGRLATPEPNAVAERLAGHRLERFQVPVWMIWSVVAGLGGVVLTLLVDVGWLGFVVRNALLVSLALYAFQGIAIIWSLLQRRKVGPGQRIGIAVGLIFGLVIPGLNLVLLLGLPGLGLSEVWVNYHRFERDGDER